MMRTIQNIHQEMKREAQRQVLFLSNEGNFRAFNGTWDPVVKPYVL